MDDLVQISKQLNNAKYEAVISLPILRFFCNSRSWNALGSSIVMLWSLYIEINVSVTHALGDLNMTAVMGIIYYCETVLI